MRRLVVFGTLVILGVVGYGTAYVMAGPKTGKQSDHITICHSGNGKKFTEISPADVGALEGHVKNHSDDIIPPFAVIKNGKTVTFSGQNMDTVYGAGFTGAEVLANGCDIPRGENPAITQTQTTEVSTTLPVTVTAPGTTITDPGGTTTDQVTVTVSLPGETTTAAGTTTVVTVPKKVTTTVTLPERTISLPGVTVTAPGETVERPAETVTLPGTTVTVAAAATTTVVTVTGPTQIVRGGVLAKKTAQVTLRTPRRVIRVAGRVYHLRGKGKFARKKVIVVVVRPRGCPKGTVLFHGRCSAVVHGKG
jgi:hypothetical protein